MALMESNDLSRMLMEESTELLSNLDPGDNELVQHLIGKGLFYQLAHLFVLFYFLTIVMYCVYLSLIGVCPLDFFLCLPLYSRDFCQL